MTEKRFINDIDNGKLIDTKGELSTIYYSDSVDFYGLWEFLNKLNDENEQLKSICQDHRNHANDFKADCVRLEKENEQLKQAYNDAKSDVEKYEQILKDIMKKNILIQDIEKGLEE